MATLTGKSVDWIVMDEAAYWDERTFSWKTKHGSIPFEAEYLGTFEPPARLMTDHKELSKIVSTSPKRAGKTAAMEEMAKSFRTAAASMRSFGETYTTSSVTNPCSEIELPELSKRRDDMIDAMRWSMEHRITEDIIKGVMWEKVKPEQEEPEEPERGPLWGTW